MPGDDRRWLCASRSEQRAALTKLSGDVRRILSAIRNQADYHRQLVIVNYFSLDYASPTANRGAIELNTAMDSAAKPFEVVIADGYGELRTASVRFGGDPCLAGLLT